MRKVIAVLVILLGIVATGCEYEVPLAEKQGLPIDYSVLGLWEEITPERKPNPKSRMKISRYSETEYLVRYYGGKESLYFRGYPIRVAGVSCIQIQAKPKEGTGRYYVFSYEILNGDLFIKVLNPSLVSNELKSSSELRRAFLRHKDNKDLFIDSGRFRQMSKEQIDARISALEKERSATKKERIAIKEERIAIKEEIRDSKKEISALDEKISATEKEIANLELLIASENGNLATVRKLLARGVNPNAKNKEGNTGLIFSAHFGHLPVVQALLAQGADVEAKNKDGFTALMSAGEEGHLPVVQALLAKGANPNVQSKSGATALMFAAQNGHAAVVQALLAKGADVNAMSEKGNTALDYASHKGHTAVVEVLRLAHNKPCPANLSAEHVFQLNGRVRTGVVIKRGDRITFRASGLVSFGAIAGSGGPEGINGFRGYNLIRGADIQHGALLARIKQQHWNGDGWYYIGKGRVITSKVDGALELDLNDSDASNNRGSFTVEVSICRAR